MAPALISASAMGRMHRYFFVWAFCGILSTLLLGVGAFDCTGKESLLRKIPSVLTLPSRCLMECTALVYAKKMQLQDTRTTRLKDSKQGDRGRYCWSMHLQCVPGESLKNAYVVMMPADEPVAGRQQQQLELRVAGTSLHRHRGPTTLARDCGLRYDVTLQLNTGQTGPLFCVQIVTEDRVLRCPPYLATVWQRNLS